MSNEIAAFFVNALFISIVKFVVFVLIPLWYLKIFIFK